MSTETKWTPGERTVRERRYGGRYILEVMSPERITIATMYCHDDGDSEALEATRADAALDAAAPKMYEAHKAWEEVLVSMWGKHWPDVETAQLADKAQRLMRAALAAADGREAP